MDVEDLRDFRPINLVGGLNKWLAKVVSKAQKSFHRLKANFGCGSYC